MASNFKHTSVLLNECIEGLHLKKDGIYVDGTIGGAGHSLKMLQTQDIRLIGIDQDSDALAASARNLSQYKDKVTLVHDNFKNAVKVLDDLGIDKIDGMLLDLGVSSYQIDTPNRGFSFRFDGELDMRMNQDNALTAFDVVNNYSESELADVIFKYGEEKFARRIARNIVNYRAKQSIKTTFELRDIIENSVPKYKGQDGLSSVQRTFQAIRIEVNGELEQLDEFIHTITDRLNRGGRLAIISFHSLEDRIVKNAFKDLACDCICPPDLPICVCNHRAKVKIITNHPITASEEELENNRRSSSAKLRIIEKI